MLTVAAIVLALTVIPPPWNIVAVGFAGAADVAETLVLWRWSRRRKPSVGIETLVGGNALAVTRLEPGRGGQVRCAGELWGARALVPIDPGATVRIVGVEGLVLDVEPAPLP